MTDHVPSDAAVTLVEFTLTDSGLPFVAATDDGGEAVLQDLLPRADGAYSEFVSQSGCDPSGQVAAAGETDWATADVLGDRDDGGLVELVVNDTCPVVTLAAFRALPRTVEAVDGEARIAAELPACIDATDVIRRFRAAYPGASLSRKRQQPYGTPIFAPDDLGVAIEEELTDRQREILLAAFRDGYYDRPRETSVEALADRFGLTKPTTHDHLRTAERKLLTLVVSAIGERADPASG